MKPGRGGQRLPRSIRIRSSRDYRAIAKAGRRVSDRYFVLVERNSQVGERQGRNLALRGSSGPRLGITASRRVGNAVVRNRVKRRIREWFRRLDPRPNRAVDWVVIARRGSGGRTSGEVERDLGGLVTRLAGGPGRSGPAKDTK